MEVSIMKKFLRYFIGLVIIPMLTTHQATPAARPHETREIVTRSKSLRDKTLAKARAKRTGKTASVYAEKSSEAPEVKVAGAKRKDHDGQKGDKGLEKRYKKDLIPAKHSPIRGLLNNSGTSCYALASLQVLFQLPEFNATLTQKACTTNPILKEYVALRNTAKKPGTPLVTKKFFDSMTPKYFSAQPLPEGQQDAEEFLRRLIEDASTHSDAFNFRQPSVITCNTCYNQRGDSIPFDPETKQELFSTSLQLALPTEDKLFALKDLLDNHFKPEKIHGKNKVKCDTCNKKQISTKQFKLESLPKILMIQLKRFDYTKGIASKITTAVSFPKKDLTLNTHATEDKETAAERSYDLVGIIYHNGDSIGRGHYVSVVKNNKNNTWNLCDDSRVNSISESNVDMCCIGSLITIHPHSDQFIPYILIYAQKVTKPVVEPVTVPATRSVTRALAKALTHAITDTGTDDDGETKEVGEPTKKKKPAVDGNGDDDDSKEPASPGDENSDDNANNTGDDATEKDKDVDDSDNDEVKTGEPVAPDYREIYAALNKGEKNMRNKKLAGINLSGSILDGVDFSGSELTNAKFCEARLSNIIFDGATLNGTDFSGAMLTDITFQDIDEEQRMTFKHVLFAKARMNNINFSDIQMGWTDFSDTFITQMEFNNVKNVVLKPSKKKKSKESRIYSPCDFSRSRITRLLIKNSEFIDMNFQHATIQEFTIRDSEIEDVNFKNCPHINELTIVRCTARNIDMQRITANDLNFNASNLNTVTFRGAKLTNFYINFAELNMPERYDFVTTTVVAARNLDFSDAIITRGFLIGRLAIAPLNGVSKTVGKALTLLTLRNPYLESKAMIHTSRIETIITNSTWHSAKLTGFNISGIRFNELYGFRTIASAQGCVFSNFLLLDDLENLGPEDTLNGMFLTLHQLKLKGAMVDGEIDDAFVSSQGPSLASGLANTAAQSVVSTVASKAAAIAIKVVS